MEETMLDSKLGRKCIFAESAPAKLKASKAAILWKRKNS